MFLYFDFFIVVLQREKKRPCGLRHKVPEGGHKTRGPCGPFDKLRDRRLKDSENLFPVCSVYAAAAHEGFGINIHVTVNRKFP